MGLHTRPLDAPELLATDVNVNTRLEWPKAHMIDAFTTQPQRG
jgi:hypothetical protein